MRLLLLSIVLLDVFFSSSQGVGYNPFPSTYSYINSNGPLGSNYSTGTFDLYFDVYIAGVTDNPGQGAGVTASVIIRKDTSLTDPAYGNATVAFAQFTHGLFHGGKQTMRQSEGLDSLLPIVTLPRQEMPENGLLACRAVSKQRGFRRCKWHEGSSAQPSVEGSV